MAHGSDVDNPMSGGELAGRFAILALISVILGALAHHAWGLNNAQTLSVTVFLIIILATLFFWSFRLAIAFSPNPLS